MGEVKLISGDRSQVTAQVQGTRLYHVELSREEHYLHVLCDCPFFKTDSACKHIWASIIAAEQKSYLLGVMGVWPLVLVEDEPLGGAPQPYASYYDDAIPSEFHLKYAAQDILLPKICSTGRCLLRTDALLPFEALQPLQWDAGEPWQFRVVVERQQDNWILRGILLRGEDRMNLAEPTLLVEKGIL